MEPLQFDDGRLRKAVKAAMNSEGGPYYVRKAWGRADTQIGSYTYLDNAKKACRSGYHVYDANGKLIYSAPVFQKGIRYRMLTRPHPADRSQKHLHRLVQYDTIPVSKETLFQTRRLR
ncbi:MAG: hypothetical protein ACLR6B_09210 [Blautia sp.]